MASRKGAVHVATMRRVYKNKTYESHLLRRSYREGGKVLHETLGNLSHLPAETIDLIRRSLRGEAFAPVSQVFEVTSSRAHGHVQAVRAAMARLKFDSLMASRPSRERGLVCALVAARILAPHTKLATTRWWHTTTLAEEFAVTKADEDDLYAAMDWLLVRQGAIEKKLAARHLGEGSLVLYDVSSSYFEGTSCPLARFGHNRDGKKGKLQVHYGLLTDRRGCPVAVSVHEGNTGDPETLWLQLEKLQQDFHLKTIVLVGARELARLRRHKRQSLLEATEQELEQVKGMVERGRLFGRDKIGLRVGKVVNKYKVAKHFALEIQDQSFRFHRLEDQIAQEAALDGVYVVRTGLAQEQMTAADCVRNYKSLAQLAQLPQLLTKLSLFRPPRRDKCLDCFESRLEAACSADLPSCVRCSFLREQRGGIGYVPAPLRAPQERQAPHVLAFGAFGASQRQGDPGDGGAARRAGCRGTGEGAGAGAADHGPR